MDKLSPKRRSDLMSRIRSKDTAPEIAARALLQGLGIRYRLQAKDLPGRPDIVNRKRRFVIFVHGCFWHGHSCKRGARPTSNVIFWNTKLTKNRARDRATVAALKADGWRVLTIWECELKKPKRLLTRVRAWSARL